MLSADTRSSCERCMHGILCSHPGRVGGRGDPAGDGDEVTAPLHE